MPSDPTKPPLDRVEVAVALAIAALGALVLVGSFTIDFGAGYDRIGPRFFPYLIAAGLLASGGFLLRGTLKRKTPLIPEVDLEKGRSSIGTLSAALVASVVLLERAGFVLTSVLLFWLVARAFRSRRPWRDALVGAVLSITVYFAFTGGLGLDLPRGVLDGLF